MEKININRQLIDLIKYPIITDKTTKAIEENSYCFAVTRKANKNDIKKAIEYIFSVKVKKVNTLPQAQKTKTIGKFKGNITKYKKAIIKLDNNSSIQLFEDNI